MFGPVMICMLETSDMKVSFCTNSFIDHGHENRHLSPSLRTRRRGCHMCISPQLQRGWGARETNRNNCSWCTGAFMGAFLATLLSNAIFLGANTLQDRVSSGLDGQGAARLIRELRSNCAQFSRVIPPLMHQWRISERK